MRNVVVRGLLGLALSGFVAVCSAAVVINTGASLGTYPIGTVQIPLAATGGDGTFVWTVTAGTLPPGLALRTDLPSFFPPGTASAGVIGVATTPGAYSFTLQAASAGQTAILAATMNITKLTPVARNQLPDAFIGTLYNASINVLGAAAGSTPAFTVTGGSLPSGLILASDGTITGAPATVCNCNFNVTLNDGADTVTRNFNISTLVVGFATAQILPNGVQNTTYNATITGSGGAGGYSYQNFGGLPNGLSLSPGGAISGTITAGPGKYNFNVQVTDSGSFSSQRAFSIDVASNGLPQLSPYGSLDDATVGNFFNQGFSVQGAGTGPFAFNVTGLPAGLNFRVGGLTNPNINPGDLEIYGVTQTAGNFTYSVTVTDANGNTATNPYTLLVSVLDQNPGLPGGTLGTAYSQKFRILGGTSPYSITVVSGQLPAGLTLNAATQTVSGTPLENGQFNLTLLFSDAGSNALRRSSRLDIGNAGGGISINNQSNLGQFAASATVNIQLNACCVASTTWSLLSGSMPTGLNLSTSGVLSGSLTSATPGTYTFLIQAADAAHLAASGAKQFTLVVSNLAINGNPSFGNVGAAYSQTLTTTGGTGTANFTPGSFTFLPPGLTVGPTGVISGTPTSSGAFSFTVTASDTAGNVSSRSFTISIYPAGGGPPVSISTSAGLGTIPLGDYQQQLVANGGTGTFTWAVTAGTLPPGISLRTDGASFFSPSASAGLIGVATTPGSYAFTLTVTSGGQTASQAFTLKVTALEIKDLFSLPDAFTGAFFSYQLTAQGAAAGSVPAYSIAAGSALPTGLNVSSSGLISGTPSVNGFFSFTLQVNDGTDTVVHFFQLRISAVSITTAAILPNGPAGGIPGYTQTLTAAGGTAVYTFSGCCFPQGLSLSTAGVLAGNILSSVNPGVYSFSIKVSDSAGNSYSKQMSLDVIGSTARLARLQAQTATGALEDATIGDSYSVAIAVQNGGTAPFTWTASGLPPGMSFRSGSGTTNYVGAGSVELWGTPSATGLFNVQVTATDLLNASVTQIFPLFVSAMDHTPNLPNGLLGASYNATLRVIGGNAASYSRTLVQGTLPAGLTLNSGTGLITGTPTENGNFNPVWLFTDASGATLRHSENLFINNVAGGISINNSSNLGTYTVGSTLNFTLGACCVTSYAWTQPAGALPPGVTLNSASGLLSGIMNTAGTYTFTITAADVASVAAAGVRQFILIVTPLAITTGPLTYGTLTAAYSQTLAATGGTGALTWSLPLGNFLPPGLSLSSGGVISGTPVSTGNYSFNVAVADTASHTATRFYSIDVYPAGGGPPVIISTGSNMGTWHTGTNQISLSASGGNGVYTWALVSGSTLPPGMALRTDVPTFFPSSAQAGLIGVATTPGTSSFTLSVTSAGQTVSQAFTIKFTALNIRNWNLPDVFIGVPFTYQLIPISNNGAVTFSFSSTDTSVPAWLSLSSTGLLSGTPGASGVFILHLVTSDSVDTVSEQLNLNSFVLNITTPGLLPNGTQGASYSQNLAATGGAGGYRFTVGNGLPSGLNLSLGGTIAGTITGGPGLYSFQVSVTDSNSVAYVKPMSISVVGVPVALPRISANQIFDPVYGNPYSTTIGICCGGTAPFVWTASGLPAGLFIASGPAVSSGVNPGTAQIYGVPSLAGSSTATITATDASGLVTSILLPIRVSTLDVVATDFSNGLPSGTINSAYTASIRVLGGTAPYSAVRTADGHMPAGLNVSGNGLLVSGTPLENIFGSPGFLFSDSAATPATLKRNMNISIAGGTNTIGVNGNGIDSYNLGTIPVNVSYSTGLSACCIPSLTWSLPAGSLLPPGLVLSAAGVISGIPTTSGVYTFFVRAADSTNLPNGGVRQFQLTVSPVTITTTSLPFGNAGAAYAQNFAASGTSGAVSWSLPFPTNGALPQGLTLSTGGVLSGNPVSAGNFTFYIQVTDASNNIAFRNFSLNIFAAGAVPPLSLNFGLGTRILGRSVSDLNASGGFPPYAYSLSPGATVVAGMRVQDGQPLPQGFSSTAAYLGVLTTPGTYSSSIRVTDSTGTTFDRAFTFTVVPFLLTSQFSAPKALVNSFYSYQLTATGGSGNYVWAINNQPTGLTINSSGLISGIPTVAGSYNFSVTLSEVASSTVTASFGMSIVVNPFAITTSPILPQGAANNAYNLQLLAPGCGATCSWSILSGSLPSPLTLSAGGLIAGTFTGTGGANSSFTAAAQYTFAGTATVIVSQVFALSIPPTTISGLSISTNIATSNVVGATITSVLSALGGRAPYTFTLQSGTLPAGITLQSSGASFASSLTPGFSYLAGRLIQVGTSNFTLQVTDSSTPARTATKAFSWQVSPLSIEYTNLPLTGSLVLGTAYTQQLLVIGGTGSYTAWSSNPAPVYPGLTLVPATGLVSGTPSNTGSITSAITVNDSSSGTATQNVSFNGVSSAAVNVTLGGPVNGTVVETGITNTYNLNPNGGVGPYTITPVGTLPAGVTVLVGNTLTTNFGSAYTLLVVPEAAGLLTFTLQIQDANGVTGARTYTLIATGFTNIVTQSLPDASVGAAYSAPLVVNGGSSPVFGLAPGAALPAGLSISASGVVSGTPAAGSAGTYSFNVSVSDASGTAIFTISLRVSTFAITGSSVLPVAVANTPYVYQMTQSGATGSVSWAAAGLNGALRMDSTGRITGTSTGTSRFAFTVTATDSAGAKVIRLMTLFSRNQNANQLDFSILNTALTDAFAGQSSSYNLIPTGGLPPYSWSVTAGSSVPPGLRLLSGATLPSNFSPDVTVLAGSPTTAGSYSFSLTATDSAGATITRVFNLNVSALNLPAGSPPNATVGTAYTFQFSPLYGTVPYTYSAAPVSLTQDTLPPGITLSSAGLLSGTATSSGSYAFLLNVRDGTGQNFTRRMSFNAGTSGGTYVTSTNLVGVPVGFGGLSTLNVSDGTTNAIWSVSSGSLPPGMQIVQDSVNGSSIEGTSSAPGSYTFTMRATDAVTTTRFLEHVVTYQFAPMQLTNPGPTGLAGGIFPAGQVGTAYSVNLTVAGGTAPYTFSESPFNPLPPGLTLSAAGMLSGTPTAAGVFNLIPIVNDSTSAANRLVAFSPISLVITPSGVNAPLIARGNFVSDVTQGLPANLPLDRFVKDGKTPYTFAVAPGSSLPPGMSILAGGNGVPSYLAGIPTAGGANVFAIQATDASAQTFIRNITINVSGLSLAPDTSPAGIVGTAYSVSFFGAGGAAPYTLKLVKGSDLPPGLTGSSTGVLSGIPTYPGNFTVGVILTDSLSNTLQRFYEITIDNAAGQSPAVKLGPRPVNIYYQIGDPAPSVPVSVNETSGTLAFTAGVSGITGATLSATSGTRSGSVNLNIATAGLTAGRYLGLVALGAPASINKNDAVPVIFTVANPPPCAYAVSPQNATFDAVSGTGSFSIAAASYCTWTAVSSNPAVTITSAASGSGNARINYTVGVNAPTSPQRAITITVGSGATTAVHTVTQFAAAGCSFSIDPSLIRATAAGGTAVVNVNTGATCTWTATGLGVSPAGGTGSGPVTVTIPPNATAAPVSLTATIATQTLTVSQTGVNCTFSLNSPGTSVGSGTSNGSVDISTPTGCDYNTVPGPAWVSVTSGVSGTSTGTPLTLTYSVEANSTTASRSGTLLVGGQPYQVTQAGLACSISLDTSGLGSPFAQAGGSGTIRINANGANCAWTVTNGATFATVSPLSGNGTGTITVTMNAANAAASAATGTVAISGQTVTFSQAGVSCASVYSLRSASGVVPYTGGSGSVGVIAPGACAWTTVSSDTSWLTATPTSSAGSADILFVALANPSTTTPRTATVTLSGSGSGAGSSATFTVAQAQAPCSFTLPVPGTTVASGGVAGATFAFTTAAGCTANPVSYANWITAAGPGATGSGNITYDVAANTGGASRTGTVQVGDKLFSVTQTGVALACNYSLNAYGAAYSQIGGNSSILGSQSAVGCATPVTGTTQPTIVSLGTITGPANNIFTQPYAVNAFNSATLAVRRMQITFGGKIFTIKQTSW